MNTASQAILNLVDGAFVLRIPITSFEFPNQLMQEHFNENYVESDTYPKTTFKGKILDFDINSDKINQVIKSCEFKKLQKLETKIENLKRGKAESRKALRDRIEAGQDASQIEIESMKSKVASKDNENEGVWRVLTGKSILNINLNLKHINLAVVIPEIFRTEIREIIFEVIPQDDSNSLLPLL